MGIRWDVLWVSVGVVVCLIVERGLRWVNDLLARLEAGETADAEEWALAFIGNEASGVVIHAPTAAEALGRKAHNPAA